MNIRPGSLMLPFYIVRNRGRDDYNKDILPHLFERFPLFLSYMYMYIYVFAHSVKINVFLMK